MEDFQINYTDINNLFWEYKTNLENLMNKIDYCEWCINQFIENAVFTGSTADALKSYLTDVHITMLSSLRVTAQNLLDNMTLYKAGYYDIDNSTNFKLSEEAIREFRTKSSTNYSDTESYTGKIQGAVSGISDISGVGTPSSNGVLELHEQLDQELLNFITTIQNQESSTVTALENSVDLLISSLNSCIAKVGLNQGAIASYEGAYYLTESVFAFAASAMIPIGQASATGNLTFRSGATIVAKEGISMGDGAGAQKITTDVTGNSKIKSKKLSTTDSINDIYGVLNPFPPGTGQKSSNV